MGSVIIQAAFAFLSRRQGAEIGGHGAGLTGAHLVGGDTLFGSLLVGTPTSSGSPHVASRARSASQVSFQDPHRGLAAYLEPQV